MTQFILFQLRSALSSGGRDQETKWEGDVGSQQVITIINGYSSLHSHGSTVCIFCLSLR